MQTINPNSLHELRIAVTMAEVAVKAMAYGDERRPLALSRVRKAKENLRVFIYKSKPCMSQNGKLLRP